MIEPRPIGIDHIDAKHGLAGVHRIQRLYLIELAVGSLRKIRPTFAVRAKKCGSRHFSDLWHGRGDHGQSIKYQFPPRRSCHRTEALRNRS